LNHILGWVEQLAALDVADIAPFTGAAHTALVQAGRLRADAVTDGGIPEPILANAPERAGDYFVVPKVVE
jgi:aspartyl-tRNA(Asn)/glutamyl-tRNA(Gln) amidotransferase subunit C